MTGGPRRRYTPANGITRCTLCRALDDDDHVPHPWTQKLAWLWAAGPAWRVIITCCTLAALIALALTIAFLRTLVTGS